MTIVSLYKIMVITLMNQALMLMVTCLTMTKRLRIPIPLCNDIAVWHTTKCQARISIPSTPPIETETLVERRLSTKMP
jgi:hypothetical protein